MKNYRSKLIKVIKEKIKVLVQFNKQRIISRNYHEMSFFCAKLWAAIGNPVKQITVTNFAQFLHG